MPEARAGSGAFGPHLAVLRRLTWGLGDQALSSLTNFALGILVARSVSTVELGAFGLALVTYWTGLAVGRALTSQPLVVRFSGAPTADWRDASKAAVGTSLLFGIAAGLVSVIAGYAVGGALGTALVALGIGLPGLLTQDCWRYVFFANARGRSAFVNDLAWTLAMVPALWFVLSSGHVTVFALMLAWGGSATLAGAFGILQAGFLPRPLAARRWLVAQWDLAGRFAGEAITNLGLRQVSAYAVASIGGLAVVGALRAGDLLLSPLNIAFQGIYLMAVPEGVRAIGVSERRLVTMTRVISLGLAGMVLAWGMVLLLLPADIGSLILEESWEPARTVMIPLTLGLALSGVASGAVVGLRALGAAQRSLQVTIFGSVGALVASIIGVNAAGAPGVAWAVLVFSVFATSLWWWQFGRALADHRRTPRSHGSVGAAEGRRGAPATDSL